MNPTNSIILTSHLREISAFATADASPKMEKYLKDRKGRKLSLEEINHYKKVTKSIRLTI